MMYSSICLLLQKTSYWTVVSQGVQKLRGEDKETEFLKQIGFLGAMIAPRNQIVNVICSKSKRNNKTLVLLY